jgi:hypothetical protein
MHSMSLSKHQEHDMNDLESSLLKMVFGLVRPTLLSSLKMGKHLFVCQIYIDDIILGSTNKSFSDESSKIMIDIF